MSLKCILIVSDESNSSNRNVEHNAGVGGGCIVPIIQRSFIFRTIPLTLTALRETLQEHDLRLQLMPFVINASTQHNKEGVKTRLDSDSSVKSFFTHVKSENVELVRIEATITAANEQVNSTVVSNQINLSTEETENKKEQHVERAKRRHSSNTNNTHGKVIYNVTSKSSDKSKVNENKSAQRENAMLHKLLSSTFADEELVKLVVYAPKQIYERSEAEDNVDKSNRDNKNTNSKNNYNTNELEESSVTEKMFVIPCAGVTEALYRAIGDTIPQAHLKSQIRYIDVIAIYTINKENEKSTVELKNYCKNDQELRSMLLESARTHCPFRVTYEIKHTNLTNEHVIASVNTNNTNEAEKVNINNNNDGSGNSSSAMPSVEVESDKLVYKLSHSKLEESENTHIVDDMHKDEEVMECNVEKTALKEIVNNNIPNVESKVKEHVYTSQELLRSSSVQVIVQVVRMSPSNNKESKNEEVLIHDDKQKSNKVEEMVESEAQRQRQRQRQRKEVVECEEDAVHEMTFNYNKHEVALLPRLHAKCKELSQHINIETNIMYSITCTFDKLILFVIAGGEEHALCKESDLREWLALAHEAHRPLRLKAECHYTNVNNKAMNKLITDTNCSADSVNNNNCNMKNVGLEEKDHKHKLHESTSPNTISNERTAPFSVAVSVATKQHTSNRYFNDSADDRSNSSYSKAQSNSNLHANENRKKENALQDKGVNKHTITSTNINDSLKDSKNLITKSSLHCEEHVKILEHVEKEDMLQGHDVNHEHDLHNSQKQEQHQCHFDDNKEDLESNHHNNLGNNIVKTLKNNAVEAENKVQSKLHEACQTSNTSAATAVATEQQHDIPSHQVKKNKKIHYKYTYLCHELRSPPPLHAEQIQAKSKQKEQIY